MEKKGNAKKLAAAVLFILLVGAMPAYSNPWDGNGTDTNRQVLSGEQLRNISKVAYYYDLMLKDNLAQTFICTSIVYVPAWKNWVIEKNDYCIRTDIKVVNTDTADRRRSNEEYDAFVKQYGMEVNVSKDWLEIAPKNPEVKGGPYNSISAELTYVNNRPVLEIEFESWSWQVDLHSEFHGFFILNKNKWEPYTPERK